MIKIPKAKNENDIAEQFDTFVEIVRILRKECPWDREQSNESISQLLIEEAYETIDAINNKNDDEFAKELGDLLLHIVMHAVMAEEREAFNLIDVLKKSQTKLVFRHPHVFGDVSADNPEKVTQNWEHLKFKEGRKSLLEGVPNALPALLKAERMQFKASRIGFDWTEKEDVWKKVEEEMNELKVELLSGNQEKKLDEIGDLLFALVNAIRFENIIAEEALQSTNAKFKRRFEYIEKVVSERNLTLKEMSLEQMDEIWDEAKRLGL
ncbi:MAG: nucleoside triphosphate pyrophosphohydrolase [Bacteroidota bacterium]|jgi:XTP/dITP diphosphohydrolase